MAEQMIDRMTIAFSNTDELRMARDLRKRAGSRGVNRLIKDILRRWIDQQNSTKIA